MKLSEQVIRRLRQAGLDQNTPTVNLVSDVIELCAHWAEGWCNRADDAMRIPDVLAEAERDVRKSVPSASDRCDAAMDRLSEVLADDVKGRIRVLADEDILFQGKWGDREPVGRQSHETLRMP